MQFVLYQAKETGSIGLYQSQYLWKQISQRGWRTREPSDTDFIPEEPNLFKKILNLHSEELGYGMADFSELLCMEPNDLRYLYGLQDSGRASIYLHVIK